MPARTFERFLLESGIYTDEGLAQAVAAAASGAVPLWSFVGDAKGLAPEALTERYAAWLKVPRLILARTPPSADAVALVPEKVARKHGCVPISVDGHRLVVAFVDPADVAAVADVEFAASRSVQPVAATPVEIEDAIQEAYAPGARINDFIASVPEPDFTIESAREDLADTAQASDEAPIVRLCHRILYDGIKAGASDIHIEPSLHELSVRLRVDGVLREHLRVPKWLHPPLVSRFKIIGGLDIAERRVPQDGRLDVKLEKRQYDVRVSTLPTHYGEKIVLRILGSRGLDTLEHLGLRPEQRAVLERALAQPQGTILVTGPTGAGKTTTLYALLSTRLSSGLNMVSVEDPIEQRLDGVNQVQVNSKAGLSFATTLRAILRQDPDVILVGEVRDRATAEVAFQASITGHLVLTTLHTNGAVQTVTRLRDIGVDTFLISSSLSIIIAQRLARRLCTECRRPTVPSPEIADRLGTRGARPTIYTAAGCDACGKTGYSGRVGIYEILPVTPALRDKIRAGASESELRRVGSSAGVEWLWQDGVRAVLSGLTSYEEIARVIQVDDAHTAACPACRAPIEEDFATCPYCLKALRESCATCGQDLRPGWKVCPYCRSATAPSAAPVAVVPATPPPAVTAVPADDARALPGRSVHLLVVDDDPDILLITSKTVGKLPFATRVSTAANGEDALALAERDHPDLVVLDINMPGIDGFEVCRRLRASLATAFVPVLMLTANASEQARTNGFLVGTDDYVTKPYSIAELQARVARLVRRTYGL